MKEAFSAERLIELIPQITEIQDEDLREKTIKAWSLAYNDGNFDSLASARFNKFSETITLCQHTRSVTAMSIAIGKNLIKEYGYDINMDHLICIAVLHDISKLLECEVTDGKYKKTEVGKDYQHGFFSTYYSVMVGMPHSISSAILTHTHQTKHVPISVEGIIVTYADLADADAHRFQLGQSLHVADLH